MRVCVLIFTFFLSACGFTPLYGSLGGAQSTSYDLSAISISPLEGRSGQVLTNHLSDNFYSHSPQASEKYNLIIELEQTTDRYGFNQDRSTTRESLNLKARFTLTKIDNGSVVTDGLTTQSTAYDIVQSDFSNASARADALERMLKETAQKITILLSTHFKNNGQ